MAYLRHGEKSGILNSVQMQSGFLMLRGELEARVEEVTEEARFSFFCAFDITPDEQIALEEYYREVTLGGPPIQYAELDDIGTSPL